MILSEQLAKQLRELGMLLVLVASVLVSDAGWAFLCNKLDHWASQHLEKVRRSEQEIDCVRLVQVPKNLIQGLLAQVVDPVSVGSQVQALPTRLLRLDRVGDLENLTWGIIELAMVQEEQRLLESACIDILDPDLFLSGAAFGQHGPEVGPLGEDDLTGMKRFCGRYSIIARYLWSST